MELAELRHGGRGDREGAMPLNAWFSLGGDDSGYLHVAFPHADIVRVLDETWLSTEEDPSALTRLLPNHFAYTVKNSRFWNAQSEHYRDSQAGAVHYRFVTGGACLDVMTTVAPVFEVVSSIG
jgi:hypothetical protein